MKRLTILITALCLTCLTMAAQNSTSFERLLDRYTGKEGCETVMMGQAMFKMMEEKAKASKGNAKGYEVLRNIDRICVMSVPESYGSFTDEVNDFIWNVEGISLVSSKATDDSLEKIYYTGNGNGKNDKDNTFLMMKTEAGKTTVIYITGDFNLKQISGISSIL